MRTVNLAVEIKLRFYISLALCRRRLRFIIIKLITKKKKSKPLVFINRLFSKMAAEYSNKLKLAKIKIVYQHLEEHLHLSNPAKFQQFQV